jgi:hypothetical protein
MADTRVASRSARVPRPAVLTVVWTALGILVAVYAAHEGLGLAAGSSDFFEQWVYDGLLWASAAACLGGALSEQRGRVAWLLVTVALVCWALGDTIWSIRFGNADPGPITSIEDAFWLAWYPLVVAALALLVRDRVPGFELHRWIDGVVVMLLVATPWVALFLTPVSEESHASPLAESVAFAYPLGDAVLVGAVVGVYALMAWRPGRMWLVLGIGLTAMGLADAISSVQVLQSDAGAETGLYATAWVAGAVLIAYASWQPHPGRLEPREVTGWRAIALPLVAQCVAISIQAYAYFDELPRIERALTIVVLLIAIVQIIVARPRAGPSASSAS